MVEVCISRSTKPVVNGTTIRHGFEKATVPVSKIRNVGVGRTNIYEVLVIDHKANAPYDPELPAGEVWIYLKKKDNLHLKLPVLKKGEQVEI